MRKSYFHPHSDSRTEARGAALIIVLGFVVLLSVLALAFLSSATLNRQVAKASSGLSQSKIFGQGAIDAIVGDLRQEVVDGTPVGNGTLNANTINPAPGKYSNNLPSNGLQIMIYRPQTGQVNTVMPAVAVSPYLASVPPNLIKESYHGVPFYPGAASGYNEEGLARAIDISTTTESQNGRYFTPASWNKPLLMPTFSTTDFTPTGWTGTTGLSYCPDWILVSRNGSNPTAFTADLTNPVKPTYVTGRYAYAIYDEGGLLDANVAGYPNN
jgi:hypothetical protein